MISASGKTYNLNFSRPTPVNVWVKISNLGTNSQFPSNGKQQIKQKIVDFIGSDTKRGLSIGQAVICIRLPAEVLKVPGVVDFDLQIGTSESTLGTENIQISARQKAVTKESMVTIV